MYCNNNVIFAHVNSNMLSGMRGKSKGYVVFMHVNVTHYVCCGKLF